MNAVEVPIDLSQVYHSYCSPHCNTSRSPQYNISVRGMHATRIKQGRGPSLIGYPNTSGPHIFADITDSSFEGHDGRPVTWTCSHADVTTVNVKPAPNAGACTAVKSDDVHGQRLSAKPPFFGCVGEYVPYFVGEYFEAVFRNRLLCSA